MTPLFLLSMSAWAVTGENFTVVALPDTQYYACGCNGGSTETFAAQTDWVVESVAERNVAFVTQLGDCVENGDAAPEEWAVADGAFSRLEDPATTGRAEGIPYGIAVGNHDQSPFGDPNGTTDSYNATFGVARFQSNSWYGGHYGDNNDNHYEYFSAGGVQFLVLHLEYDEAADPQVLSWASDVLGNHPDRLAIVVSHYLIDTEGAWGTQGQAIWEALRDRPNLLLMLSGHLTGAAHRSDTWGERTVHTLLSDFQGLSNGGDGWMRLMTFSPGAGTLTVETWSPTLGTFDASAENNFVLEVDLTISGPEPDSGTRTDSGTRLDSGTPSDRDSDAGDSDSAPPIDLEEPVASCGCTSNGGAGGGWMLGALVILWRRRCSLGRGRPFGHTPAP
jgi:hypothetical protein